MTIKAVADAIGHIKAQLEKLPEGKRWPLNEWPTRYLLIDPVLMGLGWNIHDYDECEVEAPMPSGQWTRTVDYLLYDPVGSPMIVIEAKFLWAIWKIPTAWNSWQVMPKNCGTDLGY